MIAYIRIYIYIHIYIYIYIYLFIYIYISKSWAHIKRYFRIWIQSVNCLISFFLCSSAPLVRVIQRPLHPHTFSRNVRLFVVGRYSESVGRNRGLQKFCVYVHIYSVWIIYAYIYIYIYTHKFSWYTYIHSYTYIIIYIHRYMCRFDQMYMYMYYEIVAAICL